MTYETIMRFSLGGQQVGEAYVTCKDGVIDISAAEEQFYAVLRKAAGQIKKDAEEAEHEKIVDALSPAQEEKLKEEHAKDYHGVDDQMADAYEDYLMNLSAAEIKKIIS